MTYYNPLNIAPVLKKYKEGPPPQRLIAEAWVRSHNYAEYVSFTGLAGFLTIPVSQEEYEYAYNEMTTEFNEYTDSRGGHL